MKHNTLKSLLSDIAAQIKLKTGDTSPIAAVDFPQAIMDIEAGDDPPEYNWRYVKRVILNQFEMANAQNLEVLYD